LLSPFVIPIAFLLGYRFQKANFIGAEQHQISALTLVKRNGNHVHPFLNRFPLLFSVVKGDISLVGSELVPAENGERNLRFKPGLTSLFRVSKNHRTDESDKQNYEHFYMQNHSLFLDVEIILKTVLKI